MHNDLVSYVDPDGQFAFLIPIAICLAAEYCMPVAAIYMSQCAGGALAASFLTGMASGYGDPLSSAFSAETCSLGNIGPTAFICNRAGLLLGAALSCNPTSRGVGLAKTAGNLAISEVSGAIALQAEKAMARQVVKSGSSVVKQKTALTAEKCMVKGVNAIIGWLYRKRDK